jgi:hypothetical protein
MKLVTNVVGWLLGLDGGLEPTTILVVVSKNQIKTRFDL